MLRAIIASKRPVGLKISGGLRTTASVAPYLALADRLMGVGWVNKSTFRVGASSLIDDLLRQAGVTKAVAPAAAPKSSY
jgi:deoxyribose-phosphate aldolase